MALPLSLILAVRFSRGRRRGGMVSLISLLSTLGIALGTAVLIIGLSAMNGFERELNNRILAVVPHGEIEPVNPPWPNWQQALQRVSRVPGVVAATPYIQFTALAASGTQMRAMQVKAVVPGLESQFSALPAFVLNNAWRDFQPDRQQIILGHGLAGKLQVTPGQWISLMIPDHDLSASAGKLRQPRRIRLQVSGILQLSGQLDHSLALIPLQDAQRYLEMGDDISGINIRAENPFNVSQIIRAAGEATGNYVYIKSWISSYGYMYRDIQMIRAIMYLAMVLVIGVACFNIVSTLVMAVKDKSADIAVLRTLGAGDGRIRGIFIWYGLLSGLSGSLSGVLLGALVSWKLTAIMGFIQQLSGHQLLSGDIYFIDFLPSQLHWLDVMIVLLTALLLSLLASWYPARRASRLNPARVLSRQ